MKAATKNLIKFYTKTNAVSVDKCNGTNASEFKF